MDNKRGRWYLLALFSTPMLFLGLTGLLGSQAKEEAEVALGDWADYGRAIFTALAMMLVGAIVAGIIILIYSVGFR